MSACKASRAGGNRHAEHDGNKLTGNFRCDHLHIMSNKKEPSDSSPEAGFLGLPKSFTALLSKESDRGAILILGAYLDEILSLIVRASCVSDNLGKELLKHRGPAGDFSSRIALCQAMGLISSDEANALNCLRRIRNAAAHFDQKGRGFDVLFDSDETKELVVAFARHLNLVVAPRDPAELRTGFVQAGRLLGTKLFLRLGLAKRSNAPKSSREEANACRERMKGTTIGKAIAEAEKEAAEGKLDKLTDLVHLVGELARTRFMPKNPPPKE